MNPKKRTPTTITIPDDLSPQAAMALHDALADLTDKVWDHYESVLVPLIINELSPPPENPDFDDEIPF